MSGLGAATPGLGVPDTLRDRRPGRRRRMADALTAFGFAGPALAVFTAFMFVPLGLLVWIALQRTSGFGRAEFIGGQNFVEILGDPIFWRALVNTGIYTVFRVPLSLAGGLALAILLNRALPGRTLFRALFYVPYVVSGIAAGLLAAWMFNEDFGIINWGLERIGVGPVPWQSASVPAMTSLVIVTFWTTVGYNMVVYLAGLQGIPRDLYEASGVDGASRWQSLRYITLPSLAPTTFFLVVIGVIESFQVFDLIFALTGGGPGNATTVLVTYAYEQGFQQRAQGYAAALGLVLYVIVLGLTLMYWRAARRRDAV